MTTGGCGTNWQLPSPGWHTFRIHNAASQNADVDLINPGNGAIYAEVEALGPGTTSPMRLNVGSGSYAFRCLFEDTEALTGRTVVVGGNARGTWPAGPRRKVKLPPGCSRSSPSTAARASTASAAAVEVPNTRSPARNPNRRSTPRRSIRSGNSRVKTQPCSRFEGAAAGVSGSGRAG